MAFEETYQPKALVQEETIPESHNEQIAEAVAAANSSDMSLQEKIDAIKTPGFASMDAINEATKTPLQRKIDEVQTSGFASAEDIQNVIDSIPETQLQQKINAVESTGTYASPDAMKAAMDLSPQPKANPKLARIFDGLSTSAAEKTADDAINQMLSSIDARSRMNAQLMHDAPIEKMDASTKSTVEILNKAYAISQQRRAFRAGRSNNAKLEGVY